MRFDLVTIFPQYFQVLELSLLGKAQDKDLLDINVHDLRQWTQYRHHTVDDTPYGGGAGMVMKADVWGKALDEIIADSPYQSNEIVLAIPTPSGKPLTQQLANELAANAQQIVVACGRYEGIDARVAQHYGAQVVEYSLGDFVLNGGEVAALALVEAVGRLVEGVVGNPQSLVEESHGQAGLLEYPVFTKPPVWRGLEVPPVLLGGNHGAIKRWRRTMALRKTAQVRPDLLAKLDCATLDVTDREVLVECGYVFAPAGSAGPDTDPTATGRPDTTLQSTALQPVTLRQATASDRDALVTLVHQTFPLACPAYLSQQAINAHLDTQLSAEKITAQLESDKYLYLVAQVGGQLVAYVMVEVIDPDALPPDTGKVCQVGTAYLSKCYALPHFHGSGVAGALLEQAVAWVRQNVPWAGAIALGTNDDNKRARKFYRRHGFKVAGRRIFDVGGTPNRDVVMVRPLND